MLRGNMDYANLFDLAIGKEIEYKVGTVCVDGTIVYSDTRIFILEDWRKDIMERCGRPVEKITLDRSTRLERLNPGDVFMAGDFPMTVTKVAGKDGVFSGAGWTRLPVFGNIKIAVVFTNITINADKRMIEGHVDSARDLSESGIADLDFIDQGGTNTGQTKTGDIWTDLQTGIVVPPGGSIAYDPETGTLAVTDAEGNAAGSIPLPPAIVEKINGGEPFTYTVQDGNGAVYTLTSDGKGKVETERTGSTGKGGSASGQFDPNTIDTRDAVVLFSGGSGRYAFDEWTEGYEQALLIKDRYENLNGYYVPCKLIPPGRTDRVACEVKQTGRDKIDPSKLVFRSGTGTEYLAQNGEIRITGGRENDAQDIFALYPAEEGKFRTLGKLKVLSYKELNLSVKLVPVNGNRLDEKAVEEYLNSDRLYGGLGIRWRVSSDSDFPYVSSDLESEGSGFFSRFTEEMKALNASYRSQRGVDKNTVYLFVMNAGKVGGNNLAGDMPRGSQFGYLFRSGQGAETLNRSVAHELAHGRFKLRHTFDSDYGKLVTVNNLMDYSGGVHLAKWQWDMLFDPALLVSPFESDEEGQLAILGGITWIGDLLGGLAKDNQEKEIEKMQALFDHLYDHYSDYFEKSKEEDVNITKTEYTDWSIRKSSHSGRIGKSVYSKFNAREDNTVNLYEKGVYVENYELEEKSYQMTIYSALSTVHLKNDKVRLKGYRELANHTYVKAGYTKKYGIIVLYDDNRQFQMLLQISGSDGPEKVAKQWLNYLAIVVASDEQKEYDKSIWDKIKDGLSKLFTREELPKVWKEETFDDLVLDPNGSWWVTQFDEPLFGDETCWKSSCCNRAANKILENAGTSTNNAQKIVIAESGNTDCSGLTGKAAEFAEAKMIIDKSLKEHGLPIMVGVQHPYENNNWKPKCSGNTPKITNHYIIIRGKKYDKAKKQYYYLFYEVGTNEPDNGKSMNNKLYINETNDLIEGKTAYITTYSGNYYIVTEVRKNIGQTY